jgi:hypothetical protein
MTATAAKRKRPDRPVYFRVEKLVRPDTGEEVGALVPMTQWDQRTMRDRKYFKGTELRADLKKRRNVKFHRLAHAIGALAVDHIEGFEALDTHAALKKLQAESGICCETSTVDIDLTSLGVGIVKAPVSAPRSIAFDEMDETEFSELVHGICNYIREKFHGVPPGELSEIIAAVEEGHA